MKDGAVLLELVLKDRYAHRGKAEDLRDQIGVRSEKSLHGSTSEKRMEGQKNGDFIARSPVF